MVFRFFLAITILLSCIGGYGLVFGSSLVFGVEVSYLGTISKNIYFDDERLSKTILAYRANSDISDYTIASSCPSETRFLEKKQGIYFFEIDFKNSYYCSNENIILKSDSETFVQTMSQLNFSERVGEIATFIDYSDADLKLYSGNLDIDIRKNEIYTQNTTETISENFRKFKNERTYYEALYQKSIIEEIIQARTKKYLVPVEGGYISEGHSKIPNAPRNYRASYTDGIHHGWDVAGDFGDPVIALDDGIIVRVVSQFGQSDFDKISYGNNLSEYQKTRNLDLLRGKQVWLKTMKGEVVFYSHLDEIPVGIEEGVFVQRGEELGTIGITGIPGGTTYTDYHLHFPIMENPYMIEKAGTYDFGDYMIWNWKLQGLGHDEVIQAQKDVFE